MTHTRCLLSKPRPESHRLLPADHYILTALRPEIHLQFGIKPKMDFLHRRRTDDKLSVGPKEFFRIQRLFNFIQRLIDRLCIVVKRMDVVDFFTRLEIRNISGLYRQ